MRLVLLLGAMFIMRSIAQWPAEEDGDFAAFQRVLVDPGAPGRCPIRILGYCLLPNHWRKEAGRPQKQSRRSRGSDGNRLGTQ